VETAAEAAAHSSCVGMAATLYWNSDTTRWEAFLRVDAAWTTIHSLSNGTFLRFAQQNCHCHPLHIVRHSLLSRQKCAGFTYLDSLRTAKRNPLLGRNRAMTQLQHLSIWTGYDDLASAKGWQRVQVQGRAAVQSSDAPFPSWVEAAAGSAPFYDALEGHWRVLLPRGGGAHGNASAPLMTLIAAEIAGPYGNVNVDTTGGHRAPALSEVGAGSSSSSAAVCPWSGDATHFGFFGWNNSSDLYFSYSWNGASWDGV
jgi:hypothetical protein